MKQRVYETPSVGVQFGKWTVISGSFPSTKSGRRMVRVRCECGNERDVAPRHLCRGKTSMCFSCARKRTGIRRRTHGESKTLLYHVWSNMKSRCLNPSGEFYQFYGGSGVRVCDEWLESFVVFRDWSLTNGYRQGLEIDRRDYYGHYEPENCRWVTQQVNNRNRRTAHLVLAWGETKSICEWIEDPRCTVSYGALWMRLTKYGMSGERAMATPLKPSLDDEQLLEIRSRLAQGESCASIARGIGTSKTSVIHIKNGVTHKES